MMGDPSPAESAAASGCASTTERSYHFGQHSVRIRERGSSKQGLGVFPLAVAACEWLAGSASEIEGKTVLELGSGCGVLGIAAAALGAERVYLTDYDSKVLANLRHNVALNFGHEGSGSSSGSPRATVVKLDWNHPDRASASLPVGAADVVLASECIYSGFSANIDLFAEALAEQPSPATTLTEGDDNPAEVGADADDERPREFENHANLVGVLSMYLARPHGVAHFFANQERSGDAVDMFVAAAESAGFAVSTSWIEMDREIECVFGAEAKPGRRYLHLELRWR